MYRGTGLDRRLKLIFKSFHNNNVDHTKLYENGTDNQCTLGNININAWQINRNKKNVGERG